MTIEIAHYDPRWPDLAKQAIDELTGALPGLFARIEHVGSTSVPGLAAKPVIDLMAGVEEVEVARAKLDEALPPLGFHFIDAGMPGRLLFVRMTGGRRSHHLHVVPDETLPTRNELLLRDYLRGNPADADRYAALKRSLAATPGLDADTYTRGKTELVQEIVDAARTARGLPLVPVWEE